MSAPLLQVRDLTVEFHSRAGVNYAVNGVSFDLHAGETLGIVGESGSGKSVTCSTLMGLLPSPPARIGKESRAWFEGIDLLHAPEKVHAGLRGRRISMIFQDPMTCLNPCMCIGDQVAEPLVLHQGLSWKEARRLAVAELARTGIPDPEKRALAYPHEFSGGMRQRVVIAIAVACRPKILICDEPTTALDVTIQAQILKLLKDLQKEFKYTIVFITHDLGVVANIADRVAVLYAGQIVELGTADSTAADHLDGLDGGRIDGENLLHADAVGNTTNSDGLLDAAMLLGDHSTLEDLDTLTSAFLDLHVDADGIADFHSGDFLELLFIQCLNQIHGYIPPKL